MSPHYPEYQELLSLAQLYLLQEYPSEPSSRIWLFSDLTTCDYFRLYAKSEKSSSTQALSPPPPHSQIPSTTPAKIVDQGLIKNSIQENSPLVQTSAPIQEPKRSQGEEKKSEGQPEAGKIEVSLTTDKKLASEEKIEKKAPQPNSSISKISFEPLNRTATSGVDFSDFKKILTEHFPLQKITDLPPEDSLLSEASIVLLASSAQTQERQFLENVADALKRYSMTASLLIAEAVDQSNGWDKVCFSSKLKLLICTQSQLERFPKIATLNRSYSAKELLSAEIKYPSCLVIDPLLYMRELELKKDLWKVLQLFA